MMPLSQRPNARDLDIDPMTFISEIDLDIIKMYLHTENHQNRTQLNNSQKAGGTLISLL